MVMLAPYFDNQPQRRNHDTWWVIKTCGADIARLFVDGSDFGWRRKRRRSSLLEEAGFGEDLHLVQVGDGEVIYCKLVLSFEVSAVDIAVPKTNGLSSELVITK